MPTWPLDITGSVKLNGSGNGTVQLGPLSGQRWNVTSTTVSTVSQVAPLPQATVYAGPSASASFVIDATFTGNGDSSDVPAVVYNGQYIWVTWAGGNANDTATARVQGMVTNRYRAGA